MARSKSISKRASPRKDTELQVAAIAEPPLESDVLIPKAAIKQFPVVGIGASAGGLAAFEAFLSAMPFAPGPGMAFVLVQHLSPDHKSLLTELVRRYTRMQVDEVQDGMEVKPNRVYISPPNRHIALLAGRLHLFTPPENRGARLSIDFFFRSLAADQHEHAVCIVLSGAGNDGSLGIRAIKAEGGMAIAQSPESSSFDGMPSSAIATGLVDYILPPSEMPSYLISYASRVTGRRHRHEVAPPLDAPDVLAKICVLLRATTGHDFSQYKENTVLRRVHRRMALYQLTSASDYLTYLQSNAEETEALFRDLLIGVTSFFRDRDAFEALQNVGIPRLFDGVEPGGQVRAWVCGCSTGEEAYSIAILVQEHIEKVRQLFKVQIFATDIDAPATLRARRGLFPASISADVSEERRERFFTRDANGLYQIQKTIRDMVVFSEQDVLKDPPFSKLGLVSCRNLFIYLRNDLQKRLLAVFHYALKSDGVLFLGSSETVGEDNGKFEILDRNAKLYGRKGDAYGVPRFSLGGKLTIPDSPNLRGSSTRAPEDLKQNAKQLTEQALLQHSGQAGVLVNSAGEIVYFHGRTGRYLEPSPGDAASNVLSMAREGLRSAVTVALNRATLQREPVLMRGIQVKTNGHFIAVDLTIVPVGNAVSLRLFLVVFEERQLGEPRVTDGSTDASASPEVAERIHALEQELRTKDEYIQQVLEEMETSGEELRSSNEEMQSVNEELQSSNEELETSKEELQSVNEELANVNADLQQKLNDLSRANNDMNNLLAGTGVGTVFVDHQLRITRFTPSATKLINLIPTDIGRPLAHTVSNLLDYQRLNEDVQSVLDTLVPVEEEVQTRLGGWYLLGVRPYRTLDNVIEGAVITFIDITARKLAEQQLTEAERFRAAAEIKTMGVVFFRQESVITYANEAFLRMVGHDRASITGGKVEWDHLISAEEKPHFEEAMEELKRAGFTAQRKRKFLRKDGSHHETLFTAMRTSESEAVGYLIDVPEKPQTT